MMVATSLRENQMSIKKSKRSFFEVKEQIKGIQHISKDKFLADDMNINQNTFRNAVARNAIPYKKLLDYCFDKKIDVLSLVYKTETTV